MADDRRDSKGARRDGAEVPEIIEVTVSPDELLGTLARLDLEAALAYDAAAELSDDPSVRRQLGGFAGDHRRHVAELNRRLEAAGEPAVTTLTAGAPVLASLLRLAGPLGPDVIVVALLGNEQLTNLSYDAALAYEWDDETEAVLERFAADEQRHLAWLARRHDEIAGHAPGGERPIVSE
jgi:rubrerythrin